MFLSLHLDRRDTNTRILCRWATWAESVCVSLWGACSCTPRQTCPNNLRFRFHLRKFNNIWIKYSHKTKIKKWDRILHWLIHFDSIQVDRLSYSGGVEGCLENDVSWEKPKKDWYVVNSLQIHCTNLVPGIVSGTKRTARELHLQLCRESSEFTGVNSVNSLHNCTCSVVSLGGR